MKSVAAPLIVSLNRGSYVLLVLILKTMRRSLLEQLLFFSKYRTQSISCQLNDWTVFYAFVSYLTLLPTLAILLFVVRVSWEAEC